MKINLRVFKEAIQKALAIDTEVLIPSFLKSLKELIGDEVASLDKNNIFNEVFYLNIYVYSVIINKRFNEQAQYLIGELNEVVESFLRNWLSEESAIRMLVALNTRLIEFSEKHNEFIEKEGKPGGWQKLSGFFVETILGTKFKENIILNFQVFTYFGTTLKYLDDYFEGLRGLFINETD